MAQASETIFQDFNCKIKIAPSPASLSHEKEIKDNESSPFISSGDEITDQDEELFAPKKEVDTDSIFIPRIRCPLAIPSSSRKTEEMSLSPRRINPPRSFSANSFRSVSENGRPLFSHASTEDDDLFPVILPSNSLRSRQNSEDRGMPSPHLENLPSRNSSPPVINRLSALSPFKEEEAPSSGFPVRRISSSYIP